MESPSIVIKRKRIKNIILRANSDGTFSVSAPLYVSNKQIEDFISLHSDWIKKRVDSFTHLPKGHNPIDDGYYLFLGEKMFFDEFEFENIDMLKMYFKQKSYQIIDPMIDTWAKKLQLSYNSISYKAMKSRWGSCNTTKKFLNFNSILISSPLEAIEYVVLHELAHLIYPHHQKEFWNFITLHMPDWEERRKKLILYEI